MRGVTDVRCHYAFVYVDGEPGDELDVVNEFVFETLVGLPTDELEAWSVTRRGRLSRRYRYSEKRIAQLCEDSDAGTLSIDRLPSEGGNAKLRFYLRNNSEIELRFQPPARLALVLDSRLPSTSERVVNFLRSAGDRFNVLHGGAGSHESWSMASAEVSSTLVDSENEPHDFVERIGIDSRRDTRLRNKARRAYPITLIGTTFAAKLGSASISSQFPELDVEELEHGALIKFTDADSELTDSEFLRRSRVFRERLKPHTIENPHDSPLS